MTYADKKEYDLAIADYTEVIERGVPDRDKWAYKYRGVAFFHNGEYDRAISDYIRCNGEGSNAWAYNSIGVVYAHKKEYDLAIGYFAKSLQENPDYPGAKGNLEQTRQMSSAATCQAANVADESSLVFTELFGQVLFTTLWEEPWKVGRMLAMGVNPVAGPMPLLTPAEQRCKTMIDRQKRDCTYSKSGPCSPAAIQRDSEECEGALKRSMNGIGGRLNR